METKEIPGRISKDNETLELMARYDFKSLSINLDRLQKHITDQLKKLPKSNVVVLLYLKEKGDS